MKKGPKKRAYDYAKKKHLEPECVEFMAAENGWLAGYRAGKKDGRDYEINREYPCFRCGNHRDQCMCDQ